MKSDWSPNDLYQVLSLGTRIAKLWAIDPQISASEVDPKTHDDNDVLLLTISTAKCVLCVFVRCQSKQSTVSIGVDSQSFLPQHAIENWFVLRPRVRKTQRRRSNLGRLPGNWSSLELEKSPYLDSNKKDECNTSMTKYDCFKYDSSMIRHLLHLYQRISPTSINVPWYVPWYVPLFSTISWSNRWVPIWHLRTQCCSWHRPGSPPMCNEDVQRMCIICA